MEGASRQWYRSPLGELLMEAREGALAGLWFRGQRYFGDIPGAAPWKGVQGPAENTAVLEAGVAWLDRYFRGEDPGAPPPHRLYGSPFRLAVWALLEQIPYGTTRSYGQLAETLGSSPRAVGGAVGRNPLSILVPCHRVVGEKGLTGYAGGLERKQALLALEGLRFR